MQKIFVINGGQTFAHSGGTFNKTITNWTKDVLENENFEIRISNVNDEFDAAEEAENFKWADVVVYHFPVWWFQVPNRLKFYIDEVFTAGHNNGIYKSDGRSRVNPAINYGTGGLMQGKKYFVTTSWNAPETAFTLEGEFFNQHSVDEGVLFGFHRMNAFTGMSHLGSFHFHDMEKAATQERIDNYEIEYKNYLKNTFQSAKSEVLN
ncbi:NAD(P)H-dependent oxidoreductase [Epilithonimonas sp.]|uniref:NAD(P)H-dependent oxidoreductase n=1 Tax=Epilithonimonas sp. TaxID=2894511 RepID=UPI0028A71BF3|nr:NAD(P)H-dependent oxidoreductase [Epilithonimonas sp.]